MSKQPVPISAVLDNVTPPAGFTDPAPEEEQAHTYETLEAPEPAQTVQIFEQERGGVAWLDIYGQKNDDNGHPHLVKISLTNRAEDAEAALRGLLKAMAVAKNEFKLNPYQPDFNSQPTSRKQEPAAAAPAKVKTTRAVTDEEGEPDYEDEPEEPKKKAQPAKTGAANTSKSGGRMKIIKIKLTPRDDEKVTVDLFAAGREYADLHVVKTPDALAEMFGDDWEPEINWDPTKAKVYNVEMWATWELSERLNSKGNPYKDVTEIESD